MRSAEFGMRNAERGTGKADLLMVSYSTCLDGGHNDGCQFVRLPHERFQPLPFDESTFDEQFHPVKRFVNFLIDDSHFRTKLRA